jgi:hypothetical protein
MGLQAHKKGNIFKAFFVQPVRTGGENYGFSNGAHCWKRRAQNISEIQIRRTKQLRTLEQHAETTPRPEFFRMSYIAQMSRFQCR